MGTNLGLAESSIEHQHVYSHLRERDWQAVTESDVLAAWLVNNDLDELEIDQTFEFRDDHVPMLWVGTVQ